jgi:hypothetical protein
MCALLVAWWALGWLGQTEPAGEIRYLRETEFNIPIDMDAQARSELAKLILFCSADQGKTWAQAATASPQALHFTYNARSDGTYWFKVGYIDKTNQSYPQDVYQGQPDLRVIVDTRRPEVKLQNQERTREQVQVSWEVRDPNLNPNGLQLEYRLTSGTVWFPVLPAPQGASGQQRINVGSAEAVQVRLTAKDMAGNQGQTVIDVAGESMMQPAGHSTPSQGSGSPGGPVLPPSPPGQQGTLTSISQTPPSGPKPPTNNEFKPAAPQGAPPTWAPQPGTPAPKPALATSDSGAPKPSGGSQPLATSTPSPGGTAPSHNRYVHPSMQFTNQTHMELNYKIPTIGPSGVGMVELWMTQDEGQTWTKHSEKAEPQPPYVFDVPGEGVYGFTLLVKSKAGLSRPAPKPGDPPSIRIEVDTTLPYVELHPVEADPRRKDILFLLWKAEDRNLSTNPITLQWSENPNGPWQAIAENIANSGGTAPLTGRYAWQLPPKMPYRIFLRVEVRDRAGNVGIAQTQEPVLVDLTVPEVEITGIGSGKK